MSKRVLATWFNESIGYRGNNLNDGGLYYADVRDVRKKEFAVLGKLTLGKLPFGKKLRITYNGKSCIATKGDKGAGGPMHPAIELHTNLAKRLGFDMKKGYDYVTIQKI